MGNAVSSDVISPIYSDLREGPRNHEQLARLQEDQEMWGNEQRGSYRGVSYYAWRHPRYKHWCGYINPNTEISSDMYEKLEEVAHGGITGDKGGPGFDCAHAGDFSMIDQDGIYRDYTYVVNNLKAMIDTFLDE